MSCNSVLTWLVKMCPLPQGDLGYNSEESLIPHDDDFKLVLWNRNTFLCYISLVLIQTLLQNNLVIDKILSV